MDQSTDSSMAARERERRAQDEEVDESVRGARDGGEIDGR
jgi:hypothetical protein